ncbi:LmeA family phospholipid-binding protein [Streptomyces fragilis]|uniref:DUF2993 domain-containing protein n=1 Tax=Streptomyces fragilis TaxID=67301 RepID=A0ABV2YMA3_9ACTN|nr:DUF2993 domain-containing protein [Streptomyces fragilis]
MRAVRILLVVALLLGGLLVAADRIAVGIAEDRTAEGLKTSQGLRDTPEVSIQGFPFLTQLADGDLDDVRLSIAEFPVEGTDGKETTVEDLDARLRGVRLDGDLTPSRAARVEGDLLVRYDELLKATRTEPQRVAPGLTAAVVGLSGGGEGRIKVKVQPALFGQELPALNVLGKVAVEDGKLRVRAASLPDLGVKVPEEAVRSVTDFDQALSELPPGLRLASVHPGDDGVRLTVTGEDVNLSSW